MHAAGLLSNQPAILKFWLLVICGWLDRRPAACIFFIDYIDYWLVSSSFQNYCCSLDEHQTLKSECQREGFSKSNSHGWVCLWLHLNVSISPFSLPLPSSLTLPSLLNINEISLPSVLLAQTRFSCCQRKNLSTKPKQFVIYHKWNWGFVLDLLTASPWLSGWIGPEKHPD